MDWTLFFTFLAACGAAATTGYMFKPGEFYDGLQKPEWVPKRWMFPVVWTVLYILMAWAATRVAVQPLNGQAMAFWALQIALNTLWTPIFFGLNKMRAALVVIVLLWFAVALTCWSFAKVDLWACVLILPYLAWVTVATALNYTVMKLNPEVA